jgi:hypothetical protein
MDWDYQVWCYKKYKNLKPGYCYRIMGQGDLSMISDTDKSGYGYCIKLEYYSSRFAGGSLKEEHYYFTEEEMSEYFVSSYTELQPALKSEKRNEKINEVLK